MSTPLQQLLTRPGTVALGRGLAGMRAPSAPSMDGTALQCLAADAVAAAADSPFLQGGLKEAAGLLCCISLPQAAQGGGSARLAVQAAAGGLMEALGNSPVAKNVLICAHSADNDVYVFSYGLVFQWLVCVCRTCSHDDDVAFVC